MACGEDAVMPKMYPDQFKREVIVSGRGYSVVGAAVNAASACWFSAFKIRGGSGM